MFSKLLKDEAGFVHASQYLLFTTIFSIGMIAGLTAFRDSVVVELGDVALGLENLDQSYTVDATFGTLEKQFGYADDDAGDDTPDSPPGTIELNQPAAPE